MKVKYTLFTLLLTLTGQLFIKAQINVKQSHPRVLLDSSIILKLQSRKAGNTNEWQQLSTRINAISGYNSQFIMNNVYEGQQYAFMYALSFYAGGNITHRDSAVSLFKEYFTNYTQDSSMYYDSGYESRSTMVETAMLYDWLYNYLTPTFRNAVRTRLIHWANWILTKPNIYGIWTGPYYYEGNNYTMGHFVGITSVGFAIQSEDATNGNKFISKVDSIRPFLMNYTNTRLKHGDANEGWGYGAGYAVNYLKALAIFKTSTINNIDHFQTTSYDEDIVKFLPFATLPNITHMLPEGDWARESTGELWEFHRLAADLVSSYCNNSLTQQIGVFWANETVPFNKFAVTAYRWFPFLFSNKEITPLDYRTQSMYQSNFIYTDTSGTDQFIRRTGWNSNSQWVSYRGGARYGDHAHNGSGHFSVYDNGWLLIDNNIKSHSGIEGADSMHNCMHIEKMNNFDMYPFHEPIEHTTGIRRDLSQEYSYLWTNSTPVFSARAQVFNCVDKNQRQFLYLPGLEKIAVFDIVKTNTNYKKWFGLNYDGTPSLSNDSSYSFYSNTQKTVYAHTCYPPTKSVKTYSNALRIGNKNNQAKDYFMHLVSVLPNGAPALQVIPMNKDNGRVSQSDFYGSFHQESHKDYCILFAGDDPTYSHDSLVYEIPFVGKIPHSYIAGMQISTNYFVSHAYTNSGTIKIRVTLFNRPNSTQITSSTGGILSFEISDPLALNYVNSETTSYHVFYNKTEEQLLIESMTNNSKASIVHLQDLSGKTILKVTNPSAHQIQIPTSDLSKGVYLLSIENHDKTLVYRKKVIIH